MLWTPICISTCLWDRSGQWGITWWRNTILPSIGCSKSLPLIDYYRLGLVMIFPYAPQALQESQALWESLACLVGCLLFSNPCWSQQHLSGSYCANRRVHSAAVLSCEVRSLRYCCAMLPTSGSCGFASVSNEQMDSRTLEMVRAGLQLSLRMSRQIWPLLFILQW